jgi:hypothetical protein
MDADLTERWRRGAAPFDLECVRTDELVPLAELRAALALVVGALHARHPVPLLAFDDWHEHDGFVSSSRECGWQELVAALADDASLYRARTGDVFVCRAFYAADHSFLLRFYVAEENEDGAGFWGDLDFTAAPAVLDELAPRLRGLLSTPLVREGAKAYFDSAYAG